MNNQGFHACLDWFTCKDNQRIGLSANYLFRNPYNNRIRWRIRWPYIGFVYRCGHSCQYLGEKERPITVHLFNGTILGQIYTKNPSEVLSKGFFSDSYSKPPCTWLHNKRL